METIWGVSCSWRVAARASPGPAGVAGVVLRRAATCCTCARVQMRSDVYMNKFKCITIYEMGLAVLHTAHLWLCPCYFVVCESTEA